MLALNLAVHTSYFLFNFKFMYLKQTKLFDLFRIFVVFFVIQYAHDRLVVNQGPKTEYRVNLNELLDNDEHFLFDNKAFRVLIKHVSNSYAHLVNSNFDLSEIVGEKSNKKGKLE